MDLAEREIVDPGEIDKIIAEKRYKENMEGVKEGFPYEEIFKGEDSPFQRYLDQKTKEYNERMEHFEEEIEERLTKKDEEEDDEFDDEVEASISKQSSGTTMKAVVMDDLEDI